MRRLALLLPVFLLLVSVVHAESYTRTLSSDALNKYAAEYYTQRSDSGCYEMGSQFYATQSECQGVLDQIKTHADYTVVDACGQITKTSYTYTFPGPACSGSISQYGFQIVGGSNASPATAAGEGGSSANSPSTGVLQNPLNNINSLPDLLDTVLKALVELGSILLVVMLVYVGFLFVSAQGNAEKLTTARSALMWTVIGGLILLGAEAISQVIQATVKSL